MTGTYFRTLDRKRRVYVPDDFISELGNPCFITHGLPGTLLLFREEHWPELARHWAQSPSMRVLQYAGTQRVAFKPCGGPKGANPGMRVLVPAALADYADLNPHDEAAVVGVGAGVLICRATYWQTQVALASGRMLQQWVRLREGAGR